MLEQPLVLVMLQSIYYCMWLYLLFIHSRGKDKCENTSFQQILWHSVNGSSEVAISLARTCQKFI